jgi:hypothetical protein
MNPSITLFEPSGRLNADLAKQHSRIVKGASWKRQRIVVVLPADSMISTNVALSHWNLGFPPNNGVVRILAQGMEVGEAYSSCIEQVLAHPELGKWEYLLTIEHDNCPPADGVIKLLERMEAHPEFSCIGGLYWTKGENGVAQIWGDPKDPVINFRPQPPDPAGGLVECCGTGMGFNLWRLQMFRDERLRKPWFKTLKGDATSTQDLYMWSDARKFGYRCAISCDVQVGHWDQANEIMW